MTQDELDEIRSKHSAWLQKSESGEMADLYRKDAQWLDMRGADFYRANMESANLTGTNMEGTCLARVNLKGADLSEAILYNANLEEADLRDACLDNTKFDGACLRNARIYKCDAVNADLTKEQLDSVIICSPMVLLPEDIEAKNKRRLKALEKAVPYLLEALDIKIIDQVVFAGICRADAVDARYTDALFINLDDHTRVMLSGLLLKENENAPYGINTFGFPKYVDNVKVIQCKAITEPE